MSGQFLYTRRYVGPVQAVVLDWAGTTVDFGCRAPAAVFRRAFAARGVELTNGEARGPMGMEKRAHIATLLADPAIQARWRDRHGGMSTDADIDALYHDFIPMQLAVLAQHADLIPGLLPAIAALRAKGIRIGSNSGYSGEMMAVLAPLAAAAGYQPDCIVTADQLPAGRPSPFMAFRVLTELGVYPVAAAVKVDDTPTGIEEGLNAGMWTVGVSLSGNETGLSEAELAALEPDARAAVARRAEIRLRQAGAHYVCDSIADLPGIVADIEARLAEGGQP